MAWTQHVSDYLVYICTVHRFYCIKLKWVGRFAGLKGITLFSLILSLFCLSFFAEKFASVTILFSDIVTFTNIAAAVQPIDIVNMLNELYSKFDKCTNDNGVYKVKGS